MQYLHLVEDADGVSRFRDDKITLTMQDFAPPAPPMGQSAPIPASQLLYLSLPPGWRDARHRSPRRQIAFCLSGRMRVTAGNGEARIVEPGGIWCMEDVTGQGHASEVLDDQPVELAIVQLA